jgi:hypothetical protein
MSIYLDVSMEDSLGVEVVDALEDLQGDGGNVGLLHDGLGHHVGEGAARHVLHDHKQMHLHQEGLETIIKGRKFEK